MWIAYLTRHQNITPLSCRLPGSLFLHKHRFGTVRLRGDKDLPLHLRTIYTRQNKNATVLPWISCVNEAKDNGLVADLRKREDGAVVNEQQQIANPFITCVEFEHVGCHPVFYVMKAVNEWLFFSIVVEASWKRSSQMDKLSKEQRPLRRCVAQMLNKATCQTDVGKKKKQTLQISTARQHKHTETCTLTSPSFSKPG